MGDSAVAAHIGVVGYCVVLFVLWVVSRGRVSLKKEFVITTWVILHLSSKNPTCLDSLKVARVFCRTYNKSASRGCTGEF